MNPRIFISSTYYDLKHVRERLESFLDQYGFEPVLFERDKVTYQSGLDIDKSAYQEVSKCHVMILIIGGRYGTIVSHESRLNEDRRKEEEFYSITHKEFITAKSTGVPILVFIERNVYAEYQMFKKNESLFKSFSVEKPGDGLKLTFVDSINVFHFVDAVISQPIKTFDRIDEIEHYIKYQFSGWFLLYLESLKLTTQDTKVLDSVNSLNKVVEVMNEMIGAMGRKVLDGDSKELKEVNEKQFEIIAEYFCERVSSLTTFENEISAEEIAKVNFKEIVGKFYDNVLNAKRPEPPKESDRKTRMKINQEYQSDLIFKFNEYLRSINPKIEISACKVSILQYQLNNKVKPFVKDDAHKDKIVELIAEDWEIQLQEI